MLDCSVPEIVTSTPPGPDTDDRTEEEPLRRRIAAEDPERLPTSAETTATGLPPGTVLARRYLITSLLGRGGLGEVYLAEDLTLREVVALKLLLEKETGDASRQRVFLEEVRAARRVSHPNVCRVHDVGSARGRLFLSMEYLEGEDLRSLQSRVGRLPAMRALDIALQAGRGLAAIHEEGFLHLDVKPSNLMIDAGGRTKITDFGLAARTGRRARGGTRRYMSPEHAAGHVSTASDVYSFGLVLFELVTGQPAFFARSAGQLGRLHRGLDPMPPGRVVPDVDPSVEEIVLACLRKDPEERPSSFGAVIGVLAGARERIAASPAAPPRRAPRPPPPSDDDSGPRLARWPSPELPDHPYPLLFAYSHPALLAGRDRDLARVRRCLRSAVPILGLRAVSGVGKSSLLQGGLVPVLRAAGQPTAFDRHPWEPGLAERLLADVFEELPPATDPSADFAALLVEVRRRLRLPAVLIVDQLEELLRRGASVELARLGLLLARTVEPLPDLSEPAVRWLLSYREDAHGDVVAWLADVLAPCRDPALGVDVPEHERDGLPWELSGEERFQALALPPLGTAPASHDPAAEAEAVFLEVLEKPLQLLDATGSARYPIRFATGHARRLARAFAEARIRRPDDPLVPELQVVLAHLLAPDPQSDPSDGTRRVVRVPKDVDAALDEALDRHLRLALDRAFAAAGLGSPEERSRALLALRELAHAEGRDRDGLPAERLGRAIGGSADVFLPRLSAADARLVFAREGPDGPRWVLSHDRLSAAVLRLFEEDWRHRRLQVDSRLLSLREFVTLESALHELGGDEPSRLPRGYFRRIESNRDALLWDESRREWWRACRRRHRRALVHRGVLALVAGSVLATLFVVVQRSVETRLEREARLEELVVGEPDAALRAFEDLRGDPEVGPDAILASLRRRPSPTEIVERGLGTIPAEDRAPRVLEIVEALAPLVDDAPEDPVRIANLVWALDHVASGDSGIAGRARDLRSRILAPLRERRPPPPLPTASDPDWIHVPAGRFRMGTPDGEPGEDLERPARTVEVDAFRILVHEVTNAELGQLDAEHAALEPDLPAAFVTWYEAVVYSAWIGGRLPTEAEWEYAARAGCEHTWCAADGSEAAPEQVAGILANARAPGTHEPVRRPVGLLEANPWGLHDMLGNLWEWTLDWSAPYPDRADRNPRGPIVGDVPRRILRGGCVRDAASFARPAARNPTNPDHDVINNGFRPVLPASG